MIEQNNSASVRQDQSANTFDSISTQSNNFSEEETKMTDCYQDSMDSDVWADNENHSHSETVETQDERKKVASSPLVGEARWLMKQGLSPVPAAPRKEGDYKKRYDATKQEYVEVIGKDGQFELRFTGKSPGYKTSKGQWFQVKTGKYQDQQPNIHNLVTWFENPENKVAVLGSRTKRIIDIDSKNFVSQVECDRYFAGLMSSPQLKNARVDRTPSGGYHIYVELPDDGTEGKTNFSKEPGGEHLGEIIGHGRYAITFPSVGYEKIQDGGFAKIESLASLGIYPVAKSKAQKTREKLNRTFELNDADIQLESLLSGATKELIQQDKHPDRSDAFVKIAKEVYGWENWLSSVGLTCNSALTYLEFVDDESFGFEAGRVDRIIASIDSENVEPALYEAHGDVGCWAKVLLRYPQVRETIPSDLVEAVEKLKAEWLGEGSEVEGGEGWTDNGEKEEKEKKPRNPAQSVAVIVIADRAKGNLAYRDSKGCFYAYAPSEGFWKALSDSEINGIISEYLEQICPCGFNLNYLSGVKGLLKSQLNQKDWESATGLINFTNGVLDIKTMELKDHSADFYLLDAPVHAYSPDAKAPKVMSYLEDAFSGNQDAIRVVRAFMRATLTRSFWLHKFLEIDGEGGTGKSTLLNLFSNLVGASNVADTTLDLIENGKWHLYGMIDKPLMMIRDSDKYNGTASRLKSLSTGEKVPLEAKNKQPDGEGAAFTGMIVIASNYAIRFSGDSNAIYRRRITLLMDKIVDESKKDPHLSEKMAIETPGLINWVLQMSEEEMKNTLLETQKYAPSVHLWGQKQTVRTDSLTLWADECLVLDSTAKAFVGGKTFGMDDINLYPNYLRFCNVQGLDHPVTVVRFTEALKSVLIAQHKLPGVYHSKPKNKSTFNGVRLRKDCDTAPTLISKEEWEAEPIGNVPIDDEIYI
jgi:P4 family phage/plasmid primase-like protien